jgi:hypothetical protein
MRATLSTLAAALSLAFVTPIAIVTPTEVAFAQGQPPAGGDAIKQIALTDKQLDAYLAAKKDMDAIINKLPEEAQEKPDPKVTAQLDAVAKKYKLADFAEYDAVESNVGLVLEGVDQETKKYVGAETVIKQEIASVKAEKGMSPKDKKDALDQLNEELKAAAPVQFPANIELVLKNLDKINAAMPQEQPGEGQQQKM